MSNEKKDWVYEQVDGIFALEGFQMTETVQKVRSAVDAGKVTRETFRREFLDYVRLHKSTEGFIESRVWM